MMRSKALALLFILLTLVGTNNTWHAPDDNDDVPMSLWHDHGAHSARFAAPAPVAAPVHCAICHWLAAFRAAAPQPHPVPPASASVAVALLIQVDRARPIDVFLQRSPRAPPTA